MKHFPGDGRDERDQHVVTSFNDCSVEEWDATYRKIWEWGIDAGLESIMVATSCCRNTLASFAPESPTPTSCRRRSPQNC